MKRIGSNSVGNTAKDVRKFIRECGYKPDMATVEKVQREVVRSQTENEAIVRRAKEQGGPPTIDARGDVQARMRAFVQRKLGDRPR